MPASDGGDERLRHVLVQRLGIFAHERGAHLLRVLVALATEAFGDLRATCHGLDGTYATCLGRVATWDEATVRSIARQVRVPDVEATCAWAVDEWARQRGVVARGRRPSWEGEVAGEVLRRMAAWEVERCHHVARTAAYESALWNGVDAPARSRRDPQTEAWMRDAADRLMAMECFRQAMERLVVEDGGQTVKEEEEEEEGEGAAFEPPTLSRLDVGGRRRGLGRRRGEEAEETDTIFPDDSISQVVAARRR